MLNADSHGVTSANIDAIVADLGQQSPTVQRMFGTDAATTGDGCQARPAQ